MLDPDVFLAGLRASGIGYFAGVPDSLLKSLCARIAESEGDATHTICANEGGAIGMAIGYHLATGNIPAVYMQNSGLGNAVNPLLSLADPDVYSIPMLLIIGWRGQPGVKDEPQHVKQGRVMLDMLEAMEIPAIVLHDAPEAMGELLEEVRRHFAVYAAPLALIVPAGCFGKHGASDSPWPSPYELTREQAVNLITCMLRTSDLVVSTTGMLSRELFELRERREEVHGRDFMLVGGMGHTVSVALGLAQARPAVRTICLDGDGSVLMHMGALAIAGQSGARNLRHIVLNNGAHDSVGGQPTVGMKIDLVRIAEAAGYRCAVRTETASALERTLQTFLDADGPSFLEVRVRKGARPDLGRPTATPQESKQAFMRAV